MGDHPNTGYFAGAAELPLETDEDYEMTRLCLLADVVGGPIVFPRYAFDINRQCMACCAHDRDINGLLISQGKRRVCPKTVNRCQNVELRRKVGFVFLHVPAVSSSFYGPCALFAACAHRRPFLRSGLGFFSETFVRSHPVKSRIKLTSSALPSFFTKRPKPSIGKDGNATLLVRCLYFPLAP